MDPIRACALAPRLRHPLAMGLPPRPRRIVLHVEIKHHEARYRAGGDADQRSGPVTPQKLDDLGIGRGVLVALAAFLLAARGRLPLAARKHCIPAVAGEVLRQLADLPIGGMPGGSHAAPLFASDGRSSASIDSMSTKRRRPTATVLSFRSAMSS